MLVGFNFNLIYVQNPQFSGIEIVAIYRRSFHSRQVDLEAGQTVSFTKLLRYFLDGSQPSIFPYFLFDG